MNKEKLYQEILKLNIIITEKQKEMLEIYATELLLYNEHTNLTAIRSKEDVYLKHFYDSLTITKIINLNDQTLLDIGTGAGFPGLVLAIIYPNLKITLLDSNNKKIKFLQIMKEKLNLNNVDCICTRAEEFARENKEKFDIVTSRAVAKIRILLELSARTLKINGEFIAMKAEVQEELKESKSAEIKLGLRLKENIKFELPNNAGKRTLLKYVKEIKTNDLYPRNYDKIIKKMI